MNDSDNAHNSNVSVKITGDGKAGYTFEFSDPDGLFDTEGNFDFTKTPAKGRAVKIGFAIDPSSVKGIAFKADGADAMWIALESVVGPGGCPKEKYQGDQFVEIRVEIPTTLTEKQRRLLEEWG